MDAFGQVRWDDELFRDASVCIWSQTKRMLVLSNKIFDTLNYPANLCGINTWRSYSLKGRIFLRWRRHAPGISEGASDLPRPLNRDASPMIPPRRAICRKLTHLKFVEVFHARFLRRGNGASDALHIYEDLRQDCFRWQEPPATRNNLGRPLDRESDQ